MADEYIRKQDAIRLAEQGQVQGFPWQFQMLVRLPPVDVAPVVHAHWIRHENADIICGYYVPNFECSQCGTWKEDDSDYCPDCGAKMDGEGEKT